LFYHCPAKEASLAMVGENKQPADSAAPFYCKGADLGKG
jgi:hypothetical protein